MRVKLRVVVPVLVLLAGAADASAATIELRCAGSGGKNEDSSGEKICAAAPGKARSVAGTVKNDAGAPVAATVLVQRKTWTPTGSAGFSVENDGPPQRITAKPDGTFSFRSDPDPIYEYAVTVEADPALGVGAASAMAKVQRQVTVKVEKLGGGRVRLTVRGAPKAAKALITDAAGYKIPGVGAKKLRGGAATFDLGRRRGQFSYFVDLGRVEDLYWFTGRRPTFRL